MYVVTWWKLFDLHAMHADTLQEAQAIKDYLAQLSELMPRHSVVPIRIISLLEYELDEARRARPQPLVAKQLKE